MTLLCVYKLLNIDARNLTTPTTVMMLVGNKKDLEHQRDVTYTEAEAFAKDHDLVFLETSAKTYFFFFYIYFIFLIFLFFISFFLNIFIFLNIF